MNSTMENSVLGLSEISHAIVEALRKALEDEFPEMMQDFNITERNGAGQYRWNFIITQLRNVCTHLGWVATGLCQRGAWKLPVLFYEKNKVLITFMTEGTFSQIQLRRDKGKHYLCGAASFNQGIAPQYEQLEIPLPGIAPEEEKWVAQSQVQLANAVYKDVGEISGHVIILFDTQADRLLRVRAVRLTPTLKISTEKEDWSHLIRMPYDATQLVSPQISDTDEDELLVSLK